MLVLESDLIDNFNIFSTKNKKNHIKDRQFLGTLIEEKKLKFITNLNYFSGQIKMYFSTKK